MTSIGRFRILHRLPSRIHVTSSSRSYRSQNRRQERSNDTFKTNEMRELARGSEKERRESGERQRDNTHPFRNARLCKKGLNHRLDLKRDVLAANAIPAPIETKRLMEVEVKLKLVTKEDHSKALEFFSPFHKKKYNQENFFFDGARRELSSNSHIMRIRFYNQDEKAVLTVKVAFSLRFGANRSNRDA